MSDAQDSLHASRITDQPFMPPSREEWYRPCKVCRMAEAAHRESTLYDPARQVKTLLHMTYLDQHLEKRDFALGGSAVLALRGMRPIRDLDIYVSPGFYRHVFNSDKGWVQFDSDPNDPVGHSKLPQLVKVVNHITCTMAREWKHGGYPKRIDVQDSIGDPEFVQGIPCIPLHIVYEWKKSVGRPKDIQDVEMIDKWRETHG